MYNTACYYGEWLKLDVPNVFFSSRANVGSESITTSKVRFERKLEISELKGIDTGSISNELH